MFIKFKPQMIKVKPFVDDAMSSLITSTQLVNNLCKINQVKVK